MLPFVFVPGRSGADPRSRNARPLVHSCLKRDWQRGTRFAVGGLLAAGGVALMGLAIGWFRKTEPDPAPWKEPPELIVEGIYKWTQNPMYLGMGLLQAGLGLLFASVWPLLLVPVTWWVIYSIAIRHEEAYLTEKFRESDEHYRRAVRRWL